MVLSRRQRERVSSSSGRTRRARDASATNRVGAILSVGVIVLGLVASVCGAVAWRTSVHNSHRAAFEADARSTAATLAMALQRDADLVATGGALVTDSPTVSNATFTQWFDTLGASHRYPGTIGFAYVERVTPAELPSFAAAVAADPPLGVSVPHPFVVQPPGRRSTYCLMRLTTLQLSPSLQSRVDALATARNEFGNFVSPTTDECANPTFDRLLTATRAGSLTVGSFAQVLDTSSGGRAGSRSAMGSPFGKLYPIELLTPVDSLASPGDPAHLLGWIGGLFDANTLLGPVATEDHLAFSLSVPATGGSSLEVAHVGKLAGQTYVQTSHLSAQGGWILRLAGSTDGFWTSSRQGWGVIAIGLVLTALAFALVRNVTRSRTMALALVASKSAELRHQAMHDSLTDLPNRALILDRTEHALARARRDGTSVALLYVDLDGFKDVNDANGHGVGDCLLQAVAERFIGTLRDADTVGRLGGDEFVVLLEGGPADHPEQVADRLLASCREPVAVPSLPGVALTVGASIGIATGVREDASDLLRDADIALYRAKETGKGRAVVFESSMHAEVRRRVDLDAELHQALVDEQFFLVYQPLFSIDTMHVVGAEALVRWRHPTRGVVPPMEFIPRLEASGLITDVGRFVLLEACRQAQRWHRAGVPLTISVNVAALQLESPDFVAHVLHVLEHTGVDPRSVVLEITETALMHDSDRIARRLHSLRLAGLRVAIDDFGTGYSSLAYLQQFPVDVLKIDRSFVVAAATTTEGRVLVRAMVQMGRALGIETLAEGIEDIAQLELLRAEGCDLGQGFLFARPMEAEVAEQFLADHVIDDGYGAAEPNEVPTLP
jgi:diguanylate cyclase (GGDEF)-like protein